VNSELCVHHQEVTVFGSRLMNEKPNLGFKLRQDICAFGLKAPAFARLRLGGAASRRLSDDVSPMSELLYVHEYQPWGRMIGKAKTGL
jgi:hypothetical protein